MQVTTDAELAARLRAGGLEAVKGRTWDASLDLLAEGYRTAIVEHAARTAERDMPITGAEAAAVAAAGTQGPRVA